jgi:hypothetical protein
MNDACIPVSVIRECRAAGGWGAHLLCGYEPLLAVSALLAGEE